MNPQNLQRGVHLTFYCHSRARHDGVLLSEWLLEQARQRGIGGGSVFRAIAGYGHHGTMHEERFFELAGDVPVVVEFVAQEADADALVARLAAAHIDVFCVRLPASFTMLAPAGDRP